MQALKSPPLCGKKFFIKKNLPEKQWFVFCNKTQREKMRFLREVKWVKEYANQLFKLSCFHCWMYNFVAQTKFQIWSNSVTWCGGWRNKKLNLIKGVERGQVKSCNFTVQQSFLYWKMYVVHIWFNWKLVVLVKNLEGSGTWINCKIWQCP